MQEIKSRKLPDNSDKLKLCCICKIQKSIIQCFSFNRRNNCYSYCCKECDSKRRKNSIKNLTKEERHIYLKERREYFYKTRNKQLLSRYRKFDKDRNLPFDLDIEFVNKMVLLPCEYCGYDSCGLDRKDNSIGHTKDNCVSCCWECNTAKMDNFSYDEMKIIGAAIKEVKDKRCDSQKTAHL